ncbi:MAG: GNAT family N-acetyltransferase [Deltaproteobacteria bacterium]|nr:GNAT family N-acetyltransferase [Deltaproteobacteria bacterium]
MRVREAVFVREQGVPAREEWDGRDAGCVHLLAEVDGRAAGTARILPAGRGEAKIGRMAVVAEQRGRGVGRALMEEALRLCRARGWSELRLDAQTQAVAFYARFGFEARGEVFLDAGIPHREMRRALESTAS